MYSKWRKWEKKGYLDRIKGYQLLLDTHSKINKAFHDQNIFSNLEDFKKEITEQKDKYIKEKESCLIFWMNIFIYILLKF